MSYPRPNTDTRIALLYYDFTLTLPEEIERYWSGNRNISAASLAFFANRYLSLIGVIPVLYEYFWLMPEKVSW